MLQERARELAECLVPASSQVEGGQHIAACVSTLLMAYPSMRMTADESRMTTKVFVRTLEDQPLWAVQEACFKWSRGDIPKGNPAFPPSASELRALATELSIGHRQQQAQIERILGARVYIRPSPEERQRVIERFQAMLAQTMSAPAPEQTEGTAA